MTDQGRRQVELVDAGFILENEARMRATFLEHAGLEVGLVDTACALLVRTLEHVRPGEGRLVLTIGGEERQYDRRVLNACALMGAHSVRVIRAARAVLSCGFEAEARAFDRILVELMAHREAMLGDPTGAEARAWLERERVYGISKRVAEMTDAEVYRNLCMEAHGDPAAVASVVDQETNMIELGPRRGVRARVSLLIYAGFARDQAHVVSKLSGTTEIADLKILDGAFDAAWDRLKPEFEGIRDNA